MEGRNFKSKHQGHLDQRHVAAIQEGRRCQMMQIFKSEQILIQQGRDQIYKIQSDQALICF